jgi:hypothetical protein
MKKLSIILSVVVVSAILLAAATYKAPTHDPRLQGVWELQDQYFYENNEVVDTAANMHGYRQVKVYSHSKVMWTRYNPTDTLEWFGYGSYTIKDNWLEERIEYGSNPMMQAIDTITVFRFELEFGQGSFRQIAMDNDGNRYFSENYKKIE